jgi:predicted hydrolase (HD superfamily)
LASLFCDIGEEIPNPKNILHSELSVEMLHKYNISEDILQAILHHHEYDDGTGPLRVTRFKIHSIAKIIRVVEECLIGIKDKDSNFQRLKDLSPTKLDSQITEACLLLFNKK